MKGLAAGAVELDELTYLLESGSNRIGAIYFPLTIAIYQCASLGISDQLKDSYRARNVGHQRVGQRLLGGFR